MKEGMCRHPYWLTSVHLSDYHYCCKGCTGWRHSPEVTEHISANTNTSFIKDTLHHMESCEPSHDIPSLYIIPGIDHIWE